VVGGCVLRARHGLDQRALARRAGTTQAQVSRIERGAISPSVATLERLMEAMGERLEVASAAGPRGNRYAHELRADYDTLSPGQRVAQTAALREALTRIAAGRAARMKVPPLEPLEVLRVLDEHDFECVHLIDIADLERARGMLD
jgi:transcriptional regulator with XRE-family HTH domain